MYFSQMIRQRAAVANHEGARSYAETPEMELYTAAVSTMLSDTFYETRDGRITRIAALVGRCDPEFVARLAVYARTQMHLRSVPILLTVLLAKCHNGDDLVARTVSKVIQRADEIPEMLMCYQCCNPSKGIKQLGRLSRQIQNGLKIAFNSFGEYQFAKYDRKGPVTLKDSLFIVHPKAKDEAQQALFDKIASGTLDTPYTWETQLSEAGQRTYVSPEQRAAAFGQIWMELIDSGKLGYMALLRNLRNIITSKVDAEHIAKVCERISDAREVAMSRQLPFRFLSAYMELLQVGDNVYVHPIQAALEAAAEASIAEIGGFGFDTSVLIAVDTSGSMFSSISQKSSMMYVHIGLLMSMMMAHKCRTCITGIFGDTWKAVNTPETGILSGTLSLLRHQNEVGFSTNGHTVIDYLIDRKIRMDKVLFFTDCQMWDSGFGGSSLCASWERYKTIFPQAKMYLFDLSGYGTTPVRTDRKDVTHISGWSDRIFEMLQAIENGEQVVQKILQTEL